MFAEATTARSASSTPIRPGNAGDFTSRHFSFCPGARLCRPDQPQYVGSLVHNLFMSVDP